MLSEAGRQYERSKQIKPLEKAQRERVYKSFTVKVEKHPAIKKFSPFNTVSRENRDSYLLRVTKEPNVGTIQQPKFSYTLPLHRRITIDQARFTRIIGEVKPQEETLDVNQLPQKCLKSQHNCDHRPLTVRQTHNWRKTLEHFDFSKQQDSKRLSLPRKLTTEQSTKEDFMHTLQNITESNFNNYRRFSFKPKVSKAHDFNSDFPHQYLREVETREKSPEYDITTNDESIVHRSMPKTKGEKRFFLYKEKVVTRHDRADTNWHTTLQYEPEPHKHKNHSIAFDQGLDRRENVVHSSYPIRLSLTRPLRVRD